MRKISFLSLVFFALAHSNLCHADDKPKSSRSSKIAHSLLAIGISHNGRMENPSVMAFGAEDGKNPVDFEQWLIPFKELTSALKINVRSMGDGKMELRSPEIVTQISEQQLQKHPNLGNVFSVS